MERKTTMVLIVLLKPILPGLNCPFYPGFIKKPTRAGFFVIKTPGFLQPCYKYILDSSKGH